MNKYVFKRHFTHVFDGRKNHSCHPEENNVVSRNQNVCREKVIQIFRLFGITQSRKRPQSAGKPSIQYVFVLTKTSTVALGANVWRLFFADYFAAVLAIPYGYTVPPPELTGNTPVLDVFHPIEIYFFKTFWQKSGLTLSYRLDCRFCKRLHFYEPLFGN